MKKLMVILSTVVTLLLVYSSLPAEQSSSDEPCPATVLRSEESQAGDFLCWVDENCDGKCDSAYIVVLTPQGPQPLFMFSCEDADRFFNDYQELVKKQRFGKRGNV
jgi:hypothetical protein